ncbi:MAG: hypothetical protein AB7Q81_22060 [Gammaproteobacteria bacterium]
MHAPELRAWLAACATPGNPACIVVVGGGPAVDEVRALQATWAFDESLAHRLALDAMAINARVAAALEPRLPRIERPTPGMAGPALWIPQPPCNWLTLPESWAVSADSIALYIAQRLGADCTFLVKSAPSAALAEASATAAAAAGLVDDHLPRQLAAGGELRLLARDEHESFAQARAAGTAPGERLSAG